MIDLTYSQFDASYVCSQAKINSSFNNQFLRSTGNQDDFDLEYCDLNVEIFPDITSINGIAKFKIKSLVDQLSTLDMDIINQLNISEVSSNGTNLSFEHKSDILTINLNHNYHKNEIFTITIKYNGHPGSSFHFDTMNGMKMIWSLVEPYGSKEWWPCKNLPDDKLDSIDINITVPRDLVVASNGLLTSKYEQNGKITYSWHEIYPIASYLVSVAAHPYYIDTTYFKYSSLDSMPVIEYISPTVYETNSPNYTQIIDMLSYFSEIYGLYPFIKEKYGNAEVPCNCGMEHQTVTSLLGPYEYLLAHELGHQWWGDMITCHDFHHIWLNEGFATYTEALWQEHKEGIPGLQTNMNGRKFLGHGSIYVDDVSQSGRIFNQNLSYNKGAWTLHMLRHVVGDEDFFKIYKAWGTSEKRFGNATTEDFRLVCEQVTGRNLGDFFDQWIYGDFHPIYLYDWDYSSQQGNYTVTLNIEQFQLDRIYKMPIDVVITTENGSKKFTIENDKKFEIFNFTLDSKPIKLDLDPESWILKETIQGISLANHDNNNIIATISNNAAIGFNKPDGSGNGLIYPKNGDNNLFFGTFILGNSIDYVVDNSLSVSGQDWVSDTNEKLSINLNNLSLIKISTGFNDSANPSSKNIHVSQSSFSFSETPYDNFIILKYKVVNNGSINLQNVFAGLLLDLDIGDYLQNQPAKNNTQNIIYQYNGNILIGLKKMSHDDKSIILTSINNAVDNLKENLKFNYLSGVKNDFDATKKGDWTTMLSSGPYELKAGDSLVLAFSIISGENENKLIINALNSQTIYDNLLLNTDNLSNMSEEKIHLYPNPAHDKLHLSLPLNFEINKIDIIDILGNIIFSTTQSMEFIDIDFLSCGVYTCKASDKNGRSLNSKFVKV